MTENNSRATDAQIAEMVATAIAFTTVYMSSNNGSNEVLDMLDGLMPIDADATPKFTEAYKVVQGLLCVVTSLTDLYARETSTSPAAVIRMIAQQNERRRPVE
jgi:hypothetical protein